MMRLTVVFLLGLLLSGTALACSCLRYETAQDHIDRTPVIFTGMALRTGILEAGGADSRATQFVVKRVWKGMPRNSVTIFHAESGGANCGVDFRSGQIYRIFAHRSQTGDLVTSTCSRPQFDWSEYRAILNRSDKRQR